MTRGAALLVFFFLFFSFGFSANSNHDQQPVEVEPMRSSPFGGGGFEKMAKAYRQLNENIRALGLTEQVPLPRLVVTGIQSAGKTSLMELIAKIPLGYTSPKTGTRCPVEYTLIHDQDQAIPRIQLNGNKIREDQLVPQIEHLMEDLARREEFSHVPLRVEIRSRDVINIVLYDTPGIIIPSEKTQEKAETIKNIIRPLVRDPKNILVLVLKCSEGAETLSDFQILEEVMTGPAEGLPPRTNWRSEAVIIVNHINKYIHERSTFPHAERAKAWLEEQQHEGQRIFVALKTDPSFVREGAPHEEVKQFLQHHESAEQQMFMSWWESLDQSATRQKKAKWNPTLWKHLSVKTAVSSVQHKLMSVFIEFIPTITNNIRRLYAAAESDLAVAREEVEDNDPKKYMDALHYMVDDFAETISSLLIVTDWTTKKGDNILRYNSAEKYKFISSKKGLTWDEEVSLQQDGDWPYHIRSKELHSSAHLGDLPLGEELKQKLVGMASIKRFTKVLKYFIYNMGMKDVTDDDILNIAIANEQNIDVLSVDKAVSILTRTQIKRVEGAYDFLKSHLLGLMDAYLEEVREFLLQGEYSDLGGDFVVLSLLEKFEEMMRDLFKEQILKVGERFAQTVDFHHKYLRTDLVFQMMLMVLANPPHKDLLITEMPLKETQSPSFQPDNETEADCDNNTSEKESNGPQKKENSSWGWLKSKKKNSKDKRKEDEDEDKPVEEETQEENESMKEKKQTPQLPDVIPKGQYFLRSELESLELDRREWEKRVMMSELVNFLHDSQGLVNIHDVLEAGLTAFPKMDLRLFKHNLPFIRECVHELFTNYMFHITLDLEAALNALILNYFPNEGKSTLKKELRVLVNELPESDVTTFLTVAREEAMKKVEAGEARLTELAKAKLEIFKVRHLLDV